MQPFLISINWILLHNKLFIEVCFLLILLKLRKIIPFHFFEEIWTKYFTFSCQFYHHLLILLRYLLIFHYFQGGFLSFQNYLFPQFFFLFHYLYFFLNPINLANYFLFHPLFINLWNLLKFRFFLFRMYLYFNIRVHLLLIDLSHIIFLYLLIINY